jgi:hypothetical protein
MPLLNLLESALVGGDQGIDVVVGQRRGHDSRASDDDLEAFVEEVV